MRSLSLEDVCRVSGRGDAGVLLAACEDPVPGDGAGKGAAEGPAFAEDTLANVTMVTCPTLTALLARADTLVLAAGESRVVRLEGAGRDHSLYVWEDSAGPRTIVVREIAGTDNGVEIDVAPDPASGTTPWAMLTLDAADCPDGPQPFIVKRHDGGVFTVPDGGYDASSSTAFAVLRGNSGYMLATPTKGPPPEP